MSIYEEFESLKQKKRKGLNSNNKRLSLLEKLLEDQNDTLVIVD